MERNVKDNRTGKDWVFIFLHLVSIRNIPYGSPGWVSLMGLKVNLVGYECFRESINSDGISRQSQRQVYWFRTSRYKLKGVLLEV